MRTRFFNIDFFAPSQILEPHTFLHLQVPCLPPAPLSAFPDLIPLLSPLDVSFEVHSVPIHSALSKFFPAVLPHRVHDAEVQEFYAADCFYETCLLQKDNGLAADDKDTSRNEVIHFETPELDELLENCSLFEEEHIQILSGVPNTENDPEMFRQVLTMQSPHEVQGLIYSVENVTAEFHVGQKAYVLEDVSVVQDQMCFHQSTFPSLEVDEMSLRSLTYSSVEEELFSLLDNTEALCWLQNDKNVINGEELLISKEYDISKKCLEPELALMDSFPEMDIRSIMETSQIQGNSSCEGIIQVDSFFSPSLVIFQEFEFLEMDSFQHFEIFLKSLVAHEPETFDCMSMKDLNIKSFNELIVSYELALVGNTFKSLPVPLFFDREKIRSLCFIVEETLADLNPQPLSVSNGIYLDWALLEEDKCNSRIYASDQSIFEEADSKSFDFDQKSFYDGTLLLDYVFSDDALSWPNSEEKESPELLLHGLAGAIGQMVGCATSKLLDGECPLPGNGEALAEKTDHRASVLFNSMSHLNDLDFFFNRHKSNSGEKNESATKKICTDDTLSKLPSNNVSEVCAATEVQFSDFLSYQVKLSDVIVTIIENFEKTYLAILQNERELIRTEFPFLPTDSSKLLGISKEKLIDCIKKERTKRITSFRDGNIMVFVTLCAIKQTAWYVCFYGIHPGHLYLKKLCKSSDCLKARLGILWSLMEDARRKLDRYMTNSHPSLTLIQKILCSSTEQSSLKVLIVAEEIFWRSLKSLLMSMGLSSSEFQNYYAHADQPDLCKGDFMENRMDALLVTDCLLVSHEHVSALFPFNKFRIILEYGGSRGSSKVSSLSPKLVGFPPLHFLSVELDKFSACKAFCEGVNMPRSAEMTMEEDEPMNVQRLEKLLNFLPIEGKFNVRSSVPADEVEAFGTKLSGVSFPEKVIIVNTRSFEKGMIVSRRSTYQRILAMEKEGAQVVERDSELPADVIISSAICLVWYHCGNIGKKATVSDEASLCLPLCIDRIATDVLTLLSFSFGGCILVFEGESNFLSTIMESSGELYAAAAGLGINLQLFLSHSPESTDEIILSCISHATKLTRGLYPKMPESETLAESFLTKFPSINPLTAHAILSSVGVLIEFLECSHECRIRAIEKYYVLEESITLFTALCKYGEREDSKSIMTDCSSASSGPDSEKCCFNVDSGRKRRKYSGSPQKIDTHMAEILHVEPPNLFTGDTMDHSKVSKPYNSWISKDPEIFDEISKPILPPKDLFGQQLGPNMAKTANHSSVVMPYDFQFPMIPQISNEMRMATSFSSDFMFDQNQASDSAGMNNLDWPNIERSENLKEDLTGEVIDLTDNTASGQDFSSICNSINVSLLASGMDNNSSKKHKSIRKLPFGKESPPSSMAAKINSSLDIWSFKKDQGKTLPEGANVCLNKYCKNDVFPGKEYEMLQEQGLTPRSAGNFKGLSIQENGVPNSGTSLSNALKSAHPHHNSPWTIEFLNRVREKSRLRQQSLPNDASSPCLRYSGNVSKFSKKRSPSIFEFFKYQGGTTPRKILEHKRQKQSAKPSSSSKNKKDSSSLLTTWTPADKRARQTLSFAVNGSGSQTKLIWSNRTQGLSKKFRNQI